LNGRAGAGAGVFSEKTRLFLLNSFRSTSPVGQAEMLGLIHDQDLNALDNESVITSMCKVDISSHLVQECVQKINTCEVTRLWLKGHIDIERRKINLQNIAVQIVFLGENQELPLKLGKSEHWETSAWGQKI